MLIVCAKFFFSLLLLLLKFPTTFNKDKKKEREKKKKKFHSWLNLYESNDIKIRMRGRLKGAFIRTNRHIREKRISFKILLTRRLVRVCISGAHQCASYVKIVCTYLKRENSVRRMFNVQYKYVTWGDVLLAKCGANGRIVIFSFCARNWEIMLLRFIIIIMRFNPLLRLARFNEFRRWMNISSTRNGKFVRSLWFPFICL